MKKKKKVALVLGGGGALGCAHIGVIKVLEKYKVPIDMVVGTSMGGVVGAGYAMGLTTEQMEKFACKFTSADFLDVNFNTSGLFSGKGVMRVINKFIPDINIEDLKMKYACVAAELTEEKEVVFKSGSLRDAVRCTLSIPGVFVPFQKNGKVYVDGGVINNLPEDVATQMGADVIIACDVIADYKAKQMPKNIIETLLFSSHIAIKEVQEYKCCHADITICPPANESSPLVFTKKRTLDAIKSGEEETEKHIKKILKLIK